MSYVSDESDVADRLNRHGEGSGDFQIIIGRTRIEYGDAKETKNREDHQYSLESARVFFEGLAFPFGTNTLL